MTSLLPNRASLHHRLPSDDDLQKDTRMESESSPPTSRWKGKGKAVEPVIETGLASPNGHTLVDDEESGDNDENTYPPMHEDVAESRTVEENLKRMELEERQRRKSLRESRPRHEHKSSLVQDIGRQIWSRRQSTASWDSHRELRREDDVGLDELDTRSQLTPSPKLSSTDMHASMDSSPSPSDPTGPLMQPIPESPQPLGELHARSAPLRPILEASPMSFISLGAQTPASPGISPVKSPPPRTMSPEIHPLRNSNQVTGRREGWWTEWLCGCIEEREERQGGFTNPFE